MKRQLQKTYNKGAYILPGSCRQKTSADTSCLNHGGGPCRDSQNNSSLRTPLQLSWPQPAGREKIRSPLAHTVLYCCIDFAKYLYIYVTCSIEHSLALYRAESDAALCYNYILNSVWSWKTHRKVKLNGERMVHCKTCISQQSSYSRCEQLVAMFIFFVLWGHSMAPRSKMIENDELSQ